MCTSQSVIVVTLFVILRKSECIMNDAPLEEDVQRKVGLECFLDDVRYENFAVDSGVECMLNVIDMYFHDQTLKTRIPNTVVTYNTELNRSAADIQDEFIRMQNERIGSVGTEGVSYQLWIASDARPVDSLLSVPLNAYVFANFYIIVIDEVQQIKDTMEDILYRTSSWNPSGKFLILFNSEEEREDGEEVAGEIFFYLTDKYALANIALLYGTTASSYDIYISVPYLKPDCRRVQVKKLSTCEDGVVQKEGITRFQLQLSRIPSRLDHCVFNLCSRVSEPYVEPSCSSGLELSILSIIRSVFHFQLNRTCTLSNRGIYENGTWTDLLGKIENGECDFVLGGFFPDNEVEEYFGVTTPYMADVYKWYVALAPLSHPWKGLISIFELSTWLCFLAVLVVSGFVWCFVGYHLPDLKVHKSLGPSFIYTWSVNMGVSIASQPVSLSLRILFAALTLYSMNVTGIYTSNLIGVFTRPAYDHQVSTITEIIESGLPFGGREEYLDWFDNPEDEHIFKAFNTSNDFMPLPRTLWSVMRGEKAILANQMYMLCQREGDQVFECPENVFSSPLQIITKQGFPLLQKFNWVIRHLKVAGIFNKIQDDFFYNHTYLDKIKKHRPEFIQPRVVLTTDHLQGAFAVILVGLTVSSAVFLVEVLFHRVWGTRRTPKDTKKFDEKFFRNYDKYFNDKEFRK